MAAQKWKINLLTESPLYIFECLLTRNITNQYSQDSSITYGWLLENLKARAFRELFLPVNDFKTCYTVNFPKKIPDFGHLEKTWNSHLIFFSHALLHINSIQYKNCIGYLIGTFSN